MTDDLNEKIARALCGADNPDSVMPGHTKKLWEWKLPDARAAIAAIADAGYVVVLKQPMAYLTRWSDGELSFSRFETKPTKHTTVMPLYTDLSDSATTFDPDEQFEKDNEL